MTGLLDSAYRYSLTSSQSQCSTILTSILQTPRLWQHHARTVCRTLITVRLSSEQKQIYLPRYFCDAFIEQANVLFFFA